MHRIIIKVQRDIQMRWIACSDQISLSIACGHGHTVQEAVDKFIEAYRGRVGIASFGATFETIQIGD